MKKTKSQFYVVRTAREAGDNLTDMVKDYNEKYLEKVVVNVIREEVGRRLALKSGEVDFINRSISPEDFELKLKEHEHGEIVIKVKEWTPEEMFDKALRLIDESNFFEVSSDFEVTDGIVYAKISGFAKGKYTGKNVGVQINVTGPKGVKGASCTLRVTGEDQAMILPAIDDLRERLSAWICPMCGSALTLKNVEDLKEGKVISCPFCDVSIGR